SGSGPAGRAGSATSRGWSAGGSTPPAWGSGSQGSRSRCCSASCPSPSRHPSRRTSLLSCEFGGAVGAAAPVDDLCFVDRVPLVIRRRQAGGAVHRAVDVGDFAARPAHEVVVVVADPRFVPR